MKLILLLLILFGVYQWQSAGSFSGIVPGRAAPDAPLQENVFPVKTRKIKNFTLKLHNSFELKALVLSKANYNLDTEAGISPTDLALGWGPMSNPGPLRSINITQGGRFYHFRYKNPPPIAHRDIVTNSSNMHIIPANDNVKSILKKVKKGKIVHLKGYLVDISTASGWRWKSSRSRSDTGKGACELFLVEDLRVLN